MADLISESRDDEFYSSDDDDEVVREVATGRCADFMCPIAPQWWLARSFHPYAPFPGNALEWESSVFDDGTTYEGLMMLDVPHNKGVLTFGHVGGGGMRRFYPGDVYEGEFDAGFTHGLGRITSPMTGRVFMGEYYAGERDGCGMEIGMAAYNQLVRHGVPPEEAWRRTKAESGDDVLTGTWSRDFLVHEGPDDKTRRYCTRAEIAGVVQEAIQVATKAAMFAYKPDGDVTLRMRMDAEGQPLWSLQDPLAYPYNTQFLAPGPLGDCHPVPDNRTLRARLISAWKNHQRVWDRYNLRRHVPQGSELDYGAAVFEKRLTAINNFKARMYEFQTGKAWPRAKLRAWRRRPGDEEEAGSARQGGARRSARGGWSWRRLQSRVTGMPDRGTPTPRAAAAGGEAEAAGSGEQLAVDDEDLLVGGDDDADGSDGEDGGDGAGDEQHAPPYASASAALDAMLRGAQDRVRRLRVRVVPRRCLKP